MYTQTLYTTDSEVGVHAGRLGATDGLCEPLRALLKRLAPGPLGEPMRRIFCDLIRLLGYTRQVEAALGDDAAFARTARAFPPVHMEARALLDFIEAQAARLREHDEVLFDALDGTSYALRHELRRVFEGELVGLSTHEDAAAMRAQVAHANGLLRNCFQQTVVALAQVFDPTLDGAAIFDDYQARFEESILLCRDLLKLIRLMRRAEQDGSRPAIIALVVNLQHFRRGSMRYLMYKDWSEYERLVKRVLATTSVGELIPVLHQFACYLETLLGHVKMRAVLVNDSFNFSELECEDEALEGVAAR